MAAAGVKTKSPSLSIVTDPPSADANVPGTTASALGPSGSLSFARMLAAVDFFGPAAAGGPSPAASTTSAVLPTADFAASRVSLTAAGTSLTQVTVIETVAVDPPLSV